MKTRKSQRPGKAVPWAFMDRFEIPDYDGEGNYLTRYRIIQTPRFSLYLHRFDGPDPRATLHDHPWNFVSLILRGGYIERRLNTHDRSVNEHHAVRRVNLIRTHDAHAITSLLRVPTWSLLLVGARRRTWGYWEPDEDTASWTWTEFDAHPHNLEFEAAKARRKAS